jgi:hypothetical protein
LRLASRSSWNVREAVGHVGFEGGLGEDVVSELGVDVVLDGLRVGLVADPVGPEVARLAADDAEAGGPGVDLFDERLDAPAPTVEPLDHVGGGVLRGEAVALVEGVEERDDLGVKRRAGVSSG